MVQHGLNRALEAAHQRGLGLAELAAPPQAWTPACSPPPRRASSSPTPYTFMQSPPLLSSAGGLDLVRGVCESVARTRQLTDAHLGQLHFLCPDALPGAAEILDHKTVTRCVARTSGRRFHLVGSAAKRDYCVIRGFCTCMNYAFSVASKPEALLCKHELAAELADALDLALTSEYDDEEWAAKLEMFSRLDLESFMPKT